MISAVDILLDLVEGLDSLVFDGFGVGTWPRSSFEERVFVTAAAPFWDCRDGVKEFPLALCIS